MRMAFRYGINYFWSGLFFKRPFTEEYTDVSRRFQIRKYPSAYAAAMRAALLISRVTNSAPCRAS